MTWSLLVIFWSLIFSRSLFVEIAVDGVFPEIVLFGDIHFWLTGLKIFLKAPRTPIYTNFEGGARAEKT